ncbi:hypothetical protein M409DRAFT_63659 [Zasmidium cellare ATCC 36951]|uniref:Xylanolytic transcriptional activator regulatory domain-containing protein n=1 Tax=Zasmidium cellare ATCC 36951 TaxID=1080233 RepID=A0A6A6CVW4_ZASCE|nr:uncharacterized protein M409DRAFT_63659 [Zasmidium cellare ATCC 36951]KAF2171327.1 hypothetical protein M409DRAFT_63659 [Zasmidium cellare ATCC 36951]
MKCTGDIPRCKNCEIHAQECVYTATRQRPRPTNAALEQLREENKRLRQQTSTPTQTLPNDGDEDQRSNVVPTSTDPLPKHGESPSPVAPTFPRPVNTSSATHASTYHGPTSTLFDDAAARRQDRPWLSSEREAWMPKLLLAAAAEQRQLESINARAGKLDFDGVDPELGLHLLNLHWNRQHHAYQATYRPAFMRDMACGGPYFSKILLNAIYYGASKFSPRLDIRKDPTDVRTAGWRFRDRVRDLLGPALDHSQVTTIQALLQMSNSLFALGDEQSASWVYAGTAFRMIIDLGLHVDATALPNLQRLSDEDIEIRRRVFWSAFVIDKMQSLYQGRPASLQAADCQVPIQFLDTYEELEHWQPFAYTSDNKYMGSASYSVSTFSELCKLCIILTDILNKMYREERTKKPASALIEDLKSLEDSIQEWKTQLPAHLHLDLSKSAESLHIPPPHVLSLLAMWNVLRVLLHRPFVSDGHLHSTSPSIAVTSFVACAEAATNIVKLVRLYDHAFSVRRAPYLIPYATYVAATVHVRIAAKRASASEAHDCLKTCLFVFDQNSATNWAVRKASMVIKNLMKKMDVAVASGSSCQGGDAARSNSSSDSQVPGNEGNEDDNLVPEPQPSEVRPEPTLVAGSFPSDLNVDAIIQSFMQEQQTSLYGQMNPSSNDMPFARSAETGLVNIPNAQWVNEYDELSLQSGGCGSVDDALFGFNNSDFEWYYPQSIQS